METIISCDNKLSLYFNQEQIYFCSMRASNPKSVHPPYMNEPPKSLDKLAKSELGSGHDCFMNGVFVYIDWKVNKIVREQLLRYNFINVISSQSLMHCFDKFKGVGMIDASINSVDELPLSFEYWISFCCNYRQLKTIYRQRRAHKRPEWQEFCDTIEQLPNSNWITGRETKA